MKPTRLLTLLVAAALGLSLMAVAPASSTPKKVVKRDTRLGVNAAKSVWEVLPGDPLIVRGRVKRGGPRVLVLQRRNKAGKWKRVKRLNRQRGKYQIGFIPKESGRFRLVVKRKVVVKPKRRVVFRRAVSRVFTATVRDKDFGPINDPAFYAETARKLTQYINIHRYNKGLPPFTLNTCLSDFASLHSRAMFEHRHFAHTATTFFLNKGYPSLDDVCLDEGPWRGENIAWFSKPGTPSEVAQRALDIWLNSPPHRALIERGLEELPEGFPPLCDYQLGVGFVRDHENYWSATMNLAYDSVDNGNPDPSCHPDRAGSPY